MAAAVTCDFEFSGVLAEDAVASNVQLDSDGHMVPAMCLAIELDSSAHSCLRVRQYFGAQQMPQCEAAARRLRRGMRVTVQVPMVSIALTGVASHIHVHHPKESST